MKAVEAMHSKGASLRPIAQMLEDRGIPPKVKPGTVAAFERSSIPVWRAPKPLRYLPASMRSAAGPFLCPLQPLQHSALFHRPSKTEWKTSSTRRLFVGQEM